MEKPLHVKVAQVLGVILPDCDEAAWLAADEEGFIPHYDTDWGATGPLIERYGMELAPCSECEWVATKHETMWQYHSRRGALPLIAACDLILALHEAGKLDAK